MPDQIGQVGGQDRHADQQRHDEPRQAEPDHAQGYQDLHEREQDDHRPCDQPEPLTISSRAPSHGASLSRDGNSLTRSVERLPESGEHRQIGVKAEASASALRPPGVSSGSASGQP
jgi:hypothetical protein